jgi:hypothetical protein
MKRLLSILILLSMLVVPAWGWSSYTEGTKRLCLQKSPVCVVVPEKAPDAFAFPKAFMVVNKSFDNGNGIAMVQAINADETVGAFVVFAKIKGTLHVIALVAEYRASGKSDVMEDKQFMSTGVPSGRLERVEKPTETKKFLRFLDSGTGV